MLAIERRNIILGKLREAGSVSVGVLAAEFGVSDKEVVKVKLDTARPLIFDGVVVRVREDFSAAMHIDTDESNAACAYGEVYGEIIKN